MNGRVFKMSLLLAGLTLTLGTINILIGFRILGNYINEKEHQIYMKCHLIPLNRQQQTEEDSSFIEEKNHSHLNNKPE